MYQGWKRAGVMGISKVIEMIREDIKEAQNRGIQWYPAADKRDGRHGEPGEILRLPKGTYNVRKDPRTATPHITVTIAPVSREAFFNRVAMMIYEVAHYGDPGEFSKAWRDRGFQEPKLHSLGGREVLETLRRIVTSYNFDESDSQTDYYFTGFYYDIMVAKPSRDAEEADARRDLEFLQLAYPTRWVPLLIEAGVEASFEDFGTNTWTFSEARAKVSRVHREQLMADLVRARQAFREGSIKIPFDIKKRTGWLAYSRSWTRPLKMKVGEIVLSVSNVVGVPIVRGEAARPGEWSWAISKLSGGRGGRYTENALVESGWAPTLEDAVNIVEAKAGLTPPELMGLEPGGGLSSLVVGGIAFATTLLLLNRAKRAST
jgi:hypothetical protein